MKKKLLYPVSCILYHFRIKREHGFTLIELLVVVAIIGVLSALLMSNFISVRQRARDAQRKSDVRQIQSALELYRADTGAYPNQIVGSNGSSYTLGACAAAFSYSSTTYIRSLPCDPMYVKNGTTNWYNGGNYFYEQLGGGTGYELVACLENANDPDGQTIASSAGCHTNANGSGWIFEVLNP